MQKYLQSLGYIPGAEVFLNSNVGDYSHETGSVTIPYGTPGKLLGYFPHASGDGSVTICVDIPTSPGQKRLVTRLDDVQHFWSVEPPATVWERLMRDD